jgi:3-methyladenine DNA glycosylase AlkD
MLDGVKHLIMKEDDVLAVEWWRKEDGLPRCHAYFVCSQRRIDYGLAMTVMAESFNS